MPTGRPLKALEVSRGARDEVVSLVRSRSRPPGSPAHHLPTPHSPKPHENTSSNFRTGVPGIFTESMT